MRILFFFVGIAFFSNCFAEEPTAKEKCISKYRSEMQELTEEYRKSLYENFKWFEDQEKKAKVSSFNFRMYKCNLEFICRLVTNWTFWNEAKKINYENVWCPDLNKNGKNNFELCETNDAQIALEIINSCMDDKSTLIKNEKLTSISEYKSYSEKNKSDILSAKLYSLNSRMRKFAENMNNLKIYLHKIIDWIFCTAE